MCLWSAKSRAWPGVFAFLLCSRRSPHCAIAPESLRAQVTASIVGTVTDQSGAVVSGATISVKSMDTGAMREVTTDDLGYYRVLSLPLGHQELKAEKARFTKYVLDGIELVVGQVAVVNPTLRVDLRRSPDQCLRPDARSSIPRLRQSPESSTSARSRIFRSTAAALTI